MLTHAYRLVTPDDSLDMLAKPAGPAQWSAQGDTDAPAWALAWQSPELAAMASDVFLWNQERRTVLLRETLVLPGDPRLQQTLAGRENGVFESPGPLPTCLLERMEARNLLVVWLPCALAPNQHVALLNLRHPALAGIELTTRKLLLTRPMLRAAFEPADALPSMPPARRDAACAPPPAPDLYAQLASRLEARQIRMGQLPRADHQPAVLGAAVQGRNDFSGVQ